MPDFPVLDRIPSFDERSRSFGIRKVLGVDVTKRKRIWTPGSYILDQGREGRCVVFGWGGELAASPHRWTIDNRWCNNTWPLVQAEDRKMGNFWADGASVLAGAKVMKNLKKVSYYAWAFGVGDVMQTVMRKGPVILGIPWYDSMYYTNKDGLVTVGGRVVGGHCIMLNGFWPKHPLFGADVFVWTNSWGAGYGINGRGFIKTEDLDRLLRDDGEACIPTDKPISLS